MAWDDNVYASSNEIAVNMQQIEDNFQVLKATFASASAPSNTLAGQFWFDTNTNILKIRNEANDAWISIFNFSTNKLLIGIDGLTASIAEINSTCDDCLATAAEINNVCDGMTKDTDGTLAANSDSRYATQKAVKTYISASIYPPQLVQSEFYFAAGTMNTSFTTVKSILAWMPLGATYMRFTGWISNDPSGTCTARANISSSYTGEIAITSATPTWISCSTGMNVSSFAGTLVTINIQTKSSYYEYSAQIAGAFFYCHTS